MLFWSVYDIATFRSKHCIENNSQLEFCIHVINTIIINIIILIINNINNWLFYFYFLMVVTLVDLFFLIYGYCDQVNIQVSYLLCMFF